MAPVRNLWQNFSVEFIEFQELSPLEILEEFLRSFNNFAILIGVIHFDAFILCGGR
jgi:hypothetical protein